MGGWVDRRVRELVHLWINGYLVDPGLTLARRVAVEGLADFVRSCFAFLVAWLVAGLFAQHCAGCACLIALVAYFFSLLVSLPYCVADRCACLLACLCLLRLICKAVPS